MDCPIQCMFVTVVYKFLMIFRRGDTKDNPIADHVVRIIKLAVFYQQFQLSYEKFNGLASLHFVVELKSCEHGI